MDQEGLNFSENHLGDGFVQYVMLVKDNKCICRMKCCNFPFKVSSRLIVSEKFANTKLFLDANWSHRLIYPSPVNRQQKEEWGKFMNFLWKHKKAAVVETKCVNLYILAANDCPEFAHARVLYKSSSRSDITSDGESDSRTPRPPSMNIPPPVAPLRDVYRKNFVRTDPTYLRTLSQTHAAWSFGAIAELVDNSRDANASRLDISVECLYSKREEKKIPVLSIIDDGHGMSHVDIVRMLSFGHKQPNEDDLDRIGRFGIGFKTGAMKLGRDALVLTQTTTSRSIAFLSQSFNEDKENLEIPIVTYCKRGNYMEVDVGIQSEATVNYHLKAIRSFSPFNEYFIGEKLGLFGEAGSGTQIYIWNLDKWGSSYALEWTTSADPESPEQIQADILIRSRRVRTRTGQISQKVPLDYSLRAYLEVMFLDPRMKIYVQRSQVRSRSLAISLNKTVVVRGNVLGKDLELILGMCSKEYERANAGIFLYWHGRLIEAYKRVGGMIYNADMGRGVLGVIDVTSLMDDGNGHVWVLNNKQGFQDCEAYAELEKWLGQKVDEHWDENYDKLQLTKLDEGCRPDREWVQCNKCRKWRMLSPDFDSESLPSEWFCYMEPFNGKCATPAQPVGDDVVTVAAKRSGFGKGKIVVQTDEKQTKRKPTSQSKSPSTKRSKTDDQQNVRNFNDPVWSDKSPASEES